MLEIKDLQVHYKKPHKPIIDKMDLSLRPGTITALVGLSGCGKTTMISAINGVLKYENRGMVSGSIKLNEKIINDLSIMEISRELGTVYQDPDTQIVFSSVYAELAFALENYCYSKEAIDERVKKVSMDLEIENLLDRNPNELSGGEKQLVVLAAILVLEPQVLLLDEIMAQVDDKGSELIKRRLVGLKNQGKIILMIEHDENNLHIADEIILMKDGKLSPYRGEL